MALSKEEAIEFIKKHQEEVGQFEVVRFHLGKVAEKSQSCTYAPILEWLHKFPKYVRGYNLKTGKFLIANTLYRLSF